MFLFQPQLRSLTFQESGFIYATLTMQNKGAYIEVTQELENDTRPRVYYRINRQEWDSFVFELVRNRKIFRRSRSWFEDCAGAEFEDDSGYELKIKGLFCARTFTGSSSSRGVKLINYLLKKHFAISLFYYKV